MLERSRYGRPVTSDDVSELSVAVCAVQRAVGAWWESPGEECGDVLADRATELCGLLTDLLQDCLAPAAAGLFIVR